MRLLFILLFFSVLSLSVGFGQSVDLLVSVTDGVSTPATLHFGLSANATDGLDNTLGEAELPPLPPTGVFDARFVGTDIGINLGQGTLRDYRKGDSTLIGTRVHEISYQVGSGAAVTISWSLPPWVEGRLEDLITGTLIDTAHAGQRELYRGKSWCHSPNSK